MKLHLEVEQGSIELTAPSDELAIQVCRRIILFLGGDQHPARVEVEAAPPAPAAPVLPYLCRRCDTAYDSLGLLDEHVAEAHPKHRAKPRAKPVAKASAPKPAPDLPKVVRARIVKLYKGGMGVPEVRETMDEAGVVLSKDTIYRLLRSEGVKVRPRGGGHASKAPAPARATAPRRPRHTPLTPSEKDHIVELHEAGEAVTSTARQMGTSVNSVKRVLAEKTTGATAPTGKKAYACDACDKSYDTEHGLKIHRGQTGHGNPPPKPTGPVALPGEGDIPLEVRQVNIALGLHFEGKSPQEISARCHLAVPTVMGWTSRAYELMAIPKPKEGPDPHAKALYEDEMGHLGRLAFAKRVLEPREG